jgi:hypothetical protein
MTFSWERSPPDLPVQPPTKYQFAINFKTGKSLGLTVPRRRSQAETPPLMVRTSRIPPLSRSDLVLWQYPDPSRSSGTSAIGDS